MKEEKLHENRIVIGKIIAPHGVRGLVKIRSFCEPGELLLKLKLELENYELIELKKQGVCKEGFICTIKSVHDRNQAELLIGKDIYTNRSNLPATEEEEFYINDVVGCRVFENDQEVGKIISVHNFGAGDILEIKLENDIFYFPFKQSIFPKIDIVNKIVEFIKPEL